MPRQRKTHDSLNPPPLLADTWRSPESGDANSLTGIPNLIHCPPPNEGGGKRNELAELDIENFLNTLTEVAFSIARRKQSNQQRPDAGSQG